MILILCYYLVSAFQFNLFSVLLSFSFFVHILYRSLKTCFKFVWFDFAAHSFNLWLICGGGESIIMKKKYFGFIAMVRLKKNLFCLTASKTASKNEGRKTEGKKQRFASVLS